MSKTEHYRGVATKINIPRDKSLIQVAEDILSKEKVKIDKYYKNALEQLTEDCSDKYFFHYKTGILYSLESKEIDPYEDIIRAEIKDETTIEYELRYYNGGAGFSECLEEAFDNLEQ